MVFPRALRSISMTGIGPDRRLSMTMKRSNPEFRILPGRPARWTWLGLAALPLAPALAQDGPDWELIDEYCTACHNYADFAGSIAFDLLDRDALLGDAATWELTLRKISTGMMPPAGEPRPARSELDHFVAALGQ